MIDQQKWFELGCPCCISSPGCRKVKTCWKGNLPIFPALDLCDQCYKGNTSCYTSKRPIAFKLHGTPCSNWWYTGGSRVSILSAFQTAWTVSQLSPGAKMQRNRPLKCVHTQSLIGLDWIGLNRWCDAKSCYKALIGCSGSPFDGKDVCFLHVR